MFKSFLLNLKSIYKNKLIFIYLIFFVAVEATLFRLSIMEVPAKTSIYYATTTNNFSIIFFGFFTLFSYESFNIINEYGLFECFHCCYKGLMRVWFSRLIIMMITVSLSVTPLFVHYTFIYHEFDLSNLYYLHTLKSIFINHISVSIIGCLLGALLSISNNRVRGYIKAALVTFVVSPLFVSFISTVYNIFGDSTSFNIFPLVNRLQLLPPNQNIGDHSIYGLPLECIRWESAIMWIILLVLAILNKLSESKKKIYSIILLSLIFLWAGFAFIITPNDSLVRKDERFFGGSPSDWYYDTQFPQQYEESDFSIAEYTMELKIGRQLYSSVQIYIDNKSDSGNYNFTLYRGYEIINITDASNNELEYTREGHYLTVFADEETEQINIKYKGNGNIFYSNNQGIALTGNFPYYPVAGFTTIPIITTNKQVKFDVTIDTNQEVFSNLEGENNHFEGVSDTITLVSGFLKEYTVGNITFIGCSIYDDTPDIDNLPQELLLLNNKIGSDFSINDDIMIFYPPNQLLQNVGYVEDTMVYENHIISKWNSINWICRGVVEGALSDEQDTFILRMVFLDVLFNMDYVIMRAAPNMPTDNEIEIYKNPENENYMHDENVITKLLLYRIDELGEEYVLSRVYDYLLNYDGSVEQLDFLLEME